MYALPDKMNPSLEALVVKPLKLVTKLEEELMCFLNLIRGNAVLMKKPEAAHELAEVAPILVRQNTVQERRSEAKQPHQKLPSFVSARDLLRRVPGWAVKRAGKVTLAAGNRCAMALPDVLYKHSPVPS